MYPAPITAMRVRSPGRRVGRGLDGMGPSAAFGRSGAERIAERVARARVVLDREASMGDVLIVRAELAACTPQAKTLRGTVEVRAGSTRTERAAPGFRTDRAGRLPKRSPSP